jgi:hypothetical protein
MIEIITFITSKILIFLFLVINFTFFFFLLTAASDKVYQLFAHGLWFSPGTPVSSTTTTGRHDIAEILLKVALNTKIQFKFIPFLFK